MSLLHATVLGYGDHFEAGLGFGVSRKGNSAKAPMSLLPREM